MSSAFNTETDTTALVGGHEQARPRILQPLQYSGSLDTYSKQDLTPAIGREYNGLQVADLLKAEDSHRLIRDLAVTISQRGVVFLRDQDVTPQQMRDFAESLTALAGCVPCLAPPTLTYLCSVFVNS